MTERTDAQRWADAESILDGNPSEFAVQELRRRRRRMHVLIWSLVGFALLVGAATAVLIAVFGHHGHHPTSRPEVPVWQEISGLVVSGIGLVVLVVGLVGFVRSGAWREARRSPALVLTRVQRRKLSKQIRGRAPLDPEHVRVARHVAGFAVDPRVRRYFAFLLTGLVLQFFGQLVMTPSTGRVVYTVFAMVAYAVLAVFWVGRQRQVRAFLERTPA